MKQVSCPIHVVIGIYKNRSWSFEFDYYNVHEIGQRRDFRSNVTLNLTKSILPTINYVEANYDSNYNKYN